MKSTVGFALALAGLGLAVSVTPVQKAVQMLEGMLVKTKAAKHEENVQFAGFSEFCKNTQASKAVNIQDENSQMELLAADIEKANSEVKRLGKEVGGHESEITGWGVDTEAATKVRDAERGTYLTTHQDYTESIAAIGGAMGMLKQQDRNAMAKSFLQKVSAFGKTPQEDRDTIDAFVQSKESGDNLGYKATAYKFQSKPIIDMLEKLAEKFKKEKTDLEAAEVARVAVFTSLMQDLRDQTADATNSIQDKTVTKAKNSQASIEKGADLAEVTKVEAADSKYLADLTQLCDQKTTEFASRTKLRDDEIEALSKAVEILGSDDVGDADKHVQAALIQGGSSFAQLRSASVAPDRRLIEFLRTESVRLDSHALSALAMQAASDPFGKIKSLISELIKRLMDQATNESSHKGWCDKELGTNKHTRETKSAEVETLAATIDGLTSDIASLKKDFAKKTAEVAKIESDVAEFTGKRNTENAANAKAVKEAQEGQKAITQAISVLKVFYAKAAKATVLAQTTKQQPVVPEIFDGAYQGEQTSTGGVLGMLDVINSDFARLESDTKSSESAAASEYDEFMSDSAQTKASLEVDLKHAKTNRLAKEGELGKAKEDIETSQKTLDSALLSFEKLKEPCMKEPMSYAERKARRKDEIESLKQALELLSADNLPSA